MSVQLLFYELPGLELCFVNSYLRVGHGVLPLYICDPGDISVTKDLGQKDRRGCKM